MLSPFAVVSHSKRCRLFVDAMARIENHLHADQRYWSLSVLVWCSKALFCSDDDENLAVVATMMNSSVRSTKKKKSHPQAAERSALFRQYSELNNLHTDNLDMDPAEAEVEDPNPQLAVEDLNCEDDGIELSGSKEHAQVGSIVAPICLSKTRSLENTG